MNDKRSGKIRKDEGERARLHPSSFILHPSSSPSTDDLLQHLILQPIDGVDADVVAVEEKRERVDLPARCVHVSGETDDAGDVAGLGVHLPRERGLAQAMAEL